MLVLTQYMGVWDSEFLISPRWCWCFYDAVYFHIYLPKVQVTIANNSYLEYLYVNSSSGNDKIHLLVLGKKDDVGID